MKIAGLDISIENPQGSTRSGTDASGKPWSVEMQSHYGYIKGTVGKDKDHIDVFVKPGTPEAYNGPVFVVDQVDPKTGKFDEHKAILGAVDIDEAKKMYRENYAKDWKGLGTISATPMREFRDWLNRGNTKKPFHQSKESTVLAPEQAREAPGRPHQARAQQDTAPRSGARYRHGRAGEAAGGGRVRLYQHQQTTQRAKGHRRLDQGRETEQVQRHLWRKLRRL